MAKVKTGNYMNIMLCSMYASLCNHIFDLSFIIGLSLDDMDLNLQNEEEEKENTQ